MALNLRKPQPDHRTWCIYCKNYHPEANGWSSRKQDCVMPGEPVRDRHTGCVKAHKTYTTVAEAKSLRSSWSPCTPRLTFVGRVRYFLGLPIGEKE